ncbi:hypothetical protein BBBOND_0208140 [Babesia bigemina]|uniref:Uncharacterized protein n=1 Tax=Babesia bigemina TaxID=5866 RepID=A0A061DCM6_BABBI|nr:hypothetical protein BBBOND_0208140 [Babesia bigemina]CDR95660.1 hypothetical protein BBBOND_0208140 [Babesia bigemina]|eukprot:XP_012767846.1 hypothetical protein BBBOND_0208140 [Babesia bigemina]
MVYQSLTDVPQNLKEGIDWLIALKGDDPQHFLQAMGTALHELLSSYPAGLTRLPALEKIKPTTKKFLQQKELQDQPFVEILLERFHKPLKRDFTTVPMCDGHIVESTNTNVVVARRVTPRSIAKSIGEVVDVAEKFLEGIKETDGYVSVYGEDATWIDSCLEDPEACAVVFVGIAPMLYAGLRTLRKVSAAAVKQGPDSDAAKHLGPIIKALGFDDGVCRDDLSAPAIRNALRGINPRILTIIYDIAGFLAFY